MTEQREGNPVYLEGKIEVRTFPRDADSHNIWVGEHYFLFQRGCLEQFATRTRACYLERALGNYNPSIPYVLKQEQVTVESFALVLARARAKEIEDTERDYQKFKRENGL